MPGGTPGAQCHLLCQPLGVCTNCGAGDLALAILPAAGFLEAWTLAESPKRPPERRPAARIGCPPGKVSDIAPGTCATIGMPGILSDCVSGLSAGTRFTNQSGGDMNEMPGGQLRNRPGSDSATPSELFPVLSKRKDLISKGLLIPVGIAFLFGMILTATAARARDLPQHPRGRDRVGLLLRALLARR